MSDDAAQASSSPRKRARVDVSADGKKIALLTGALGGIGSATAAVLRESGYEVIGMDRSQGESAADHFLQCDIRAFHADANSVRRCARQVRLVARSRCASPRCPLLTYGWLVSGERYRCTDSQNLQRQAGPAGKQVSAHLSPQTCPSCQHLLIADSLVSQRCVPDRQATAGHVVHRLGPRDVNERHRTILSHSRISTRAQSCPWLDRQCLFYSCQPNQARICCIRYQQGQSTSPGLMTVLVN